MVPILGEDAGEIEETQCSIGKAGDGETSRGNETDGGAFLIDFEFDGILRR